MSLLLFDVDHFKAFNDSNGHQVGDDCLRTVAATLQGVFKRQTDLVARYGGEEFAVILPNTDQDTAVLLAEHALGAIENTHINHPASSCSRWVTVSGGASTAIATSGGTARMPEGLLEAADAALYKAKAAGRNRVEARLLLSARDSLGAAA